MKQMVQPPSEGSRAMKRRAAVAMATAESSLPLRPRFLWSSASLAREEADRQTDGGMEGQTDGRTDRRKDRQAGDADRSTIAQRK